MSSTKPRRRGGRPPAFPNLREAVKAALKSLRRPGTRQRGKGKRGVSRRKISLRVIRDALPRKMKKVRLNTLSTACKGLKLFYKYPYKAKAVVEMSDEAWKSYNLSQRSWNM